MRLINPDYIDTQVSRLRIGRDGKLHFRTHLVTPDYAEAIAPLPAKLKKFIDNCLDTHNIIGIDLSENNITVLLTIEDGKL